MTQLVIVCALMAEAVPIIDRYKMRKQPKVPGFHLYCAPGIDLVICGMGGKRAQKGIAAYRKSTAQTVQTNWLNIGIAGALSHDIGALVWASRVGGEIIANPHSCESNAILDVISLQVPSENYRPNVLFDMEAQSCLNALSQNCAQFRPEIQFFCAKVISDNLSNSIHKLDKKTVTSLLNQNIRSIERAIDNIVNSVI